MHVSPLRGRVLHPFSPDYRNPACSIGTQSVRVAGEEVRLFLLRGAEIEAVNVHALRRGRGRLWRRLGVRCAREIKQDPAHVARWRLVIAKYSSTLVDTCQKAIDRSNQWSGVDLPQKCSRETPNHNLKQTKWCLNQTVTRADYA